MISRVVLIVARNQLFREGLRQLLKKSNFVVSGDGRDLAEAQDKADPDKPADMVILTLKGGDSMERGVAAIRQIRHSTPAIKIVALAASLSRAECIQAMRAGVDAVLTKDISSGALHASLELVMQSQQILLVPVEHLMAALASGPEPAASAPKQSGDEPRSEIRGTIEDVSNLVQFTPVRSVASAATAPLSEPQDAPYTRVGTAGRPAVSALSEREGQILLCLVRGSSNKAIARELDIAETTVKVHVKGLMRKVRASNRTQAAIWAMNHYLTSEEIAAHSNRSAIR